MLFHAATIYFIDARCKCYLRMHIIVLSFFRNKEYMHTYFLCCQVIMSQKLTSYFDYAQRHIIFALLCTTIIEAKLCNIIENAFETLCISVNSISTYSQVISILHVLVKAYQYMGVICFFFSFVFYILCIYLNDDAFFDIHFELQEILQWLE